MNDNGIPDKTASWLAYVGSFVTGIIVLGMSASKSKEIKTHAWQSIWLGIAVVILGFVFNIFDWLPVIGNLFYILKFFMGLIWFLMTLACIISAVDGKTFKIPGIYNLAEKSASN